MKKCLTAQPMARNAYLRAISDENLSSKCSHITHMLRFFVKFSSKLTSYLSVFGSSRPFPDLIQKCLLLLLCLFSSIAYAETLDQLMNHIQTMRAHFTQTIYDQNSKALEVSQGEMQLKRPSQFRWQVEKPIPQLIIANQNTLWIYDEDLQQVTVRNVKTMKGSAPTLFLSAANSDLNKWFVIKTIQKSSPNWQWFLLTSKAKDNLFAQTRLGFFNNELKEMRLTDNLGHITVIKFNNVSINPELASSLFQFKPGKGVDVINE